MNAAIVALANAFTVWKGEPVYLCPTDGVTVKRQFPKLQLWTTARVRGCDFCRARAHNKRKDGKQ